MLKPRRKSGGAVLKLSNGSIMGACCCTACVFDRVDVTAGGTAGDYGLGSIGSYVLTYNIDMSADGRYAVLQSGANNLGIANPNHRCGLWRKDIQSGTLLNITDPNMFVLGKLSGTHPCPSMSADGTKVASGSGIWNNGTWINPTFSFFVAPYSYFLSADNASISSNGQYVVFSGRYARTPFPTGTVYYKYTIYNMGTSALSTPADGYFAMVDNSGRVFYVTSYSEPTSKYVTTLKRDSTTIDSAMVVSTTAGIRQYDISDDGNYVVYVTRRMISGTQYNYIVRRNMTTGEEIQITQAYPYSSTLFESCPRISGDGRYVQYQSIDTRANLWRYDCNTGETSKSCSRYSLGHNISPDGQTCLTYAYHTMPTPVDPIPGISGAHDYYASIKDY